MARKRPYMPLYIDRWRVGTEQVAPKHRGPYLDLLCAIWMAGGMLRNDPGVMASAARLDKRQFDVFWKACSGKFLVSEDGIQHATVTEMLDSSDKIAAKMQEIRDGNKCKSNKKQGRKKQKNEQPNQRFGFTTNVVKNQTLPNDPKNEVPGASDVAPSPEVGGAPTAAAYEALKEIRRVATLRPSVSLSHMDAIKRAVWEFDGETFFLKPLSLPADAWAAICEEASAKGYRFEQQGGLRLVANN